MDSGHFPDLARFWQAADLPMPIVIVGGGRWGKVWASVITAARGSSRHLMMAARTDPDAARAWASESSEASGIVVCQSIAQAMALMPELKMAIVCSRPGDHLKDALEAFDHGLHVLVEKPISTHAAHGMQLVERSLQVRRKLAVGTEFAFIPAVHQCVQELSLKSHLKVTLQWDDPPGEARYGAAKSRHKEVDALTDLLPHAFSIFRTLASSREFQIVDAYQNAGDNCGGLHFRDHHSSDFLLTFDLASRERRRVVEVVSGADLVVIDFSAKRSTITVNGLPHALDPVLQPMTSTLRLQLGAFLSEIAVERREFPEDPAIQALIDLQKALEDFPTQQQPHLSQI
jgi:predicted dehydrogenase